MTVQGFTFDRPSEIDGTRERMTAETSSVDGVFMANSV
jgi:hypothetical protein